MIDCLRFEGWKYFDLVNLNELFAIKYKELRNDDLEDDNEDECIRQSIVL